MDEQFPQNQVIEPFGSTQGKPKTKFWKFVVAFLVIIIVAAGGFFVWNKYFSQAAKLNQQTQENYQKYLDWQKNYETAMKNDTFGGKTPEETLTMFIDALKKGDVELASKYFMLDTNENSPNYLTRKESEDGLLKAKEGGKLQDIINISLKAKSDSDQRSEYSAWFTVDNKEGISEYTIILNLNKYSNVWKIESM